jgi:nucleoside-diphosphate-sugar epimerase
VINNKPLIVIIGSEGWLGQNLRPILEPNYHIRRADLFCPNESDTMRTDVRNQEDMERAVKGADAVLHLAAFHGGYRPPPTDETRFEINVTGTFRMFQACLKLGIRKVVWASSTAASSKKGIYSITKVIGEDLCEYYHLTHDFKIAVIRFGSFTPFDFLSYGERLLNRGIDVRDCATAVERSLELLSRSSEFFERFNLVTSAFLKNDVRHSLINDTKRHLESIDPIYPDLVSRYGLNISTHFSDLDVKNVRGLLKMEPRYTFYNFLADLKQYDREGRVKPGTPRWRFEDGIKPPEDVVFPPGHTEYVY